jgi:OPT family oligopeptide transporter
MKVPPRTVFTCQIVASIWACFVQVAVMNWALGNIDDICTPTQKAHFTCPNGSAFFRNSITWGVIGPDRMLGPNSVYSSLNWFWLIGAALPIIFWGLMRMFPRSPVRLLNAPVMLGAMEWLPPASALSFFSWAFVGLFFNWYLMRRYSGWWRQYNFITSAALDAGLIISTIVVFFAIQYKEVQVPDWWGNNVPYTTMDYLYTAVRKTVAKGETFGPSTW